MCGICGIYYYKSQKTVSLSTLKKMAQTMNHRGPDDEGFFIENNLGFAHKRLSIIDLSPAGHQPMTNERNDIWLTFNGEIYNYQELRDDLIKKGHQFKSHSDTEVIIHLYEELGEKIFEKLNGMFAFALWDGRNKKLVAARDRLGIKPFYYLFDDQQLIFASEIKAILKAGIKPYPNLAAINDYLTFQFCLGEKTFFQNIKKLLPGQYLIIQDSNLRIKTYWDLDYTINTKHTKKYFTEKLSSLIQNSIKLQLRSDVPLGAHLSGGIDSTIVTCVAAKQLPAKNILKTFTGFFPCGQEYDERGYAQLVAEFTHSKYFEVSPKINDFINYLPKLIYLLDEPAAGPGLFPQYFVSQLASKHVKVVLGGQGGDEVWGGYVRYLIAYLEQSIKGTILNTQEEGRHVVTLKSTTPYLAVLRNYTPTLQNFWSQGLFGPMDERYFKLIKRAENVATILNQDFLNTLAKNTSPFEEFKQLFNFPKTLSYFNKMTHFDIKTLLPALLHIEDRMSMAASLESRVPLLDHRIVELSAQIPPIYKFKQGETKHLLKQAVKNLIPQEIINRQDKVGFAVPLNDWYQKKPMKDFLQNILLSRKARSRGIYNFSGIKQLIKNERKFGRQIWGLLCIELWYKNFID